MFTLMGGIAMFLYGMDLMGKALEQTAGSKLQGILSKMTASPVRGLLLGMVITAVIQSSGATTVMAGGVYAPSPAVPPPLWRSALSTPA